MITLLTPAVTFASVKDGKQFVLARHNPNVDADCAIFQKRPLAKLRPISMGLSPMAVDVNATVFYRNESTPQNPTYTLDVAFVDPTELVYVVQLLSVEVVAKPV